MKKSLELIPTETIEQKIHLIRNVKVIIDSDLAKLYEVTTGNLNLAVRRNMDRFPNDFMFRLTSRENQFLLLQIAIPKNRGGRQTLPYAFTEQGVAMLSSVLNSNRAVRVNIAIMRAFVKLREIMATHKDLARKIEDLERKYGKHEKEIQIIFQAIKELLSPTVPEIPKEPMGFRERRKD